MVRSFNNLSQGTKYYGNGIPKRIKLQYSCAVSDIFIMDGTMPSMVEQIQSTTS